MTEYDTQDVESIDTKDARALTEYMTVLEDQGRVRGADDLYLVVSQSGREYLVDTREGSCECPSDRYSAESCKHRQRVAFATSRRRVPSWADESEIDPRLGEHVADVDDTDAEGGHAIAADGGTTVREAVEGAEVLDTTECELEDVSGGTLVYKPVTEWRDTLGRSKRVGRELVGVTDVDDWSGIRSALARLGHDVGAVHHLEEYEPAEVGLETSDDDGPQRHEPADFGGGESTGVIDL